MKTRGHKSLSYLLSGLFCLALPLVSPYAEAQPGQPSGTMDGPRAEAQTDPQGTVDLLRITPPGTEKSGRLPEKAEGFKIRSKIAQRFYERTIAGNQFREGKLDWNLLMQLINDKPSGPIVLKLLGEVLIEFTPDEPKRLKGKRSAGGQKLRWSGRVTQKGKVVGQGLFILDENAQRITATIQSEDKLYEIVSLNNGNVRMIEIKADRFPDHRPTRQRHDESHVIPAQPPTHLARSECGDPLYLIDVLILYTLAARNTWQDKGYGSILMEFTKAIEITNKAFENSNIKAKLQIVGTQLVSTAQFTERSTLDIPLGQLQDKNSPLGRAVSRWRNKTGADLVSLWVSGGDDCGLSNRFENRGPRPGGEDGFSVVIADNGSCFLSLAHEIGHNLGARHTRWDDKVNDSNNAYNFGYLSLSDGVRTIEATNEECVVAGRNCQRVPHYSNPDIPFPGLATKTGISIGTANAADNHAQLNTTVCEAAAYRSPPQ